MQGILNKKNSSGGGSTPIKTLLYTNPSPTSEYYEGTITLNDSYNNYEYIEMTYKEMHNNNKMHSVILPYSEVIRSVGVVLGCVYGGGYIDVRTFKFKNNNQVGISYSRPINGSNNDTYQVILYTIYGINGLVIE